MSDTMRMIEAAEAQTPGEQPPIVLEWAEYRGLVEERDEARHLAACRDDELSAIEETVDEARRERDEARGLCREVLIRLTRYAHANGERTGNVIKQWSKKYPWLGPKEPDP